jgi:hypothetical protein
MAYTNQFKPFNGGYSWWVYPNVYNEVVDSETITYFSYVNSLKQTLIASFNHSTKYQTQFVLQTDTVADEHNCSAICVMPDGKILTSYTKHNTEAKIYVRKSKRAHDASDFETAIELTCSNVATYAQLLYLNSKYWLFYRVNDSSWAFRTSTDGATWGNETILVTSATGQYYLRIVPYNNTYIRIISIGHPINNTDHVLRYVRIDTTTGSIDTLGSTHLGNIDGTSLPIASTSFQAVYTPTEGKITRLFDINFYPTSAPNTSIAFAVFSSISDCEYYVTTGSVGSWTTTKVCDGGAPLEVPAGDNYYFGGAWFQPNNDKILYVARESSGIWYLEKYTTTDYNSWTLSQTIKSSGMKIHRPCQPFNAPVDNATFLMWEEGFYSSFSNYESVVKSRDWWYL